MYAKVEEVEGGFAPILKIKNVGRVDLGVYSTGEAACTHAHQTLLLLPATAACTRSVAACLSPLPLLALLQRARLRWRTMWPVSSACMRSAPKRI